jgi:predicted branched-subunit amino acid permease
MGFAALDPSYAFQRRFEPPGAPIPDWHVWIMGILLFGSWIIGSIIGLAAHELLSQHHRF